MTDTVLINPVTRDVVTLHSPRPITATDALVFTTELPAGAAGSPLHRHARLTETFDVLDGHVSFRIDRTEHVLAAGSGVTVRPGTLHAFRNASDRPAVLRCTVTPGAGFEQFLRGLQAAAESGRATAAGLPRDPRRLARLLLDADFHFPGLPMGVQGALFRALASLAPAATH